MTDAPSCGATRGLCFGAMGLAGRILSRLGIQPAERPLFGWASERMDVGKLTESVVFAEWVFHGLTAWGLIRLRMRRPELPRPYRSLAFPLAPAIYLIVRSASSAGT